MNRQRIDAIEKHFCQPGGCPACGSGQGDIIIAETLCGEGEPLGYYYEKPRPDHHLGERFPYPPDPRPVCPTCGRHNGPMLFLSAVYDAAEWAALRREAPAGGRTDC